MKKIILTGDRPTGNLHLGHYVGSLKKRIELQNEGNYDKMYVFIADTQALTDNFNNPKKVRDSVLEVAIDYLSIGLDPNKVTIFIQSLITPLSEITMYYMNMVSLARLKRNPTVKQELSQKDFNNTIPMGFLTYPISQTADITAFNANIVPVGDDQLPMIEQAREIVRSFNNIYGNTLVEPEALIPNNRICSRLPGIDGKAKMSKSLGNCIYLKDDSKTVKEKVMKMYTDPNHIKITDPGNTKDNVVFMYLEALVTDKDFKKFLPEYNNLDELKAHYEKGGLGDIKIKNFLYEVIEDILIPIRKKRKYYEENKDLVWDILQKGSLVALNDAKITLKKIRKAMLLDYFEGEDDEE